VVGSNWTFSVAVWAGFRVSGNVAPDMVKPVPVSVAALMVTAAVPEEVRVTDCVVGVLSTTLPNDKLDALRLSVGVVPATLRFKAKVSETLPAVAVSVTACAEVTEETVAVNPALVAFAGTVTVAGTVTAELLLERLTLKPPLGAAEVSVTVHASVPEPVMDALPQDNALSAAGALADMPVPLKPITIVGLVEELLVTVSFPVVVPAAAGSNSRFKLKVPPGAKVAGKVGWPLTEKNCPVTSSSEI
jgi:hypothetical protein